MPVRVQHKDAAGGPAFSRPTPVQRRWLRGGLDQPGGKLSLFDDNGQRISERTVQSCITRGWAEAWFQNPLKPDWVVCKLTHLGRAIAEEDG